MYKIIGADQREYGPVSVEQLRQWSRGLHVTSRLDALANHEVATLLDRELRGVRGAYLNSDRCAVRMYAADELTRKSPGESDDRRAGFQRSVERLGLERQHEIDEEIARSSPADLGNLLARSVRARPGERKRAHAASFADCDGQIGAREAADRCLQNGIFQSEPRSQRALHAHQRRLSLQGCGGVLGGVAGLSGVAPCGAGACGGTFGVAAVSASHWLISETVA